ncbi:heterokaryon incompatibility protein-domain-containing protein [Bipolaris maydis]|nr:heterokaryon incompatibility protein-domain-containing protein [Bipolaris maydis]
MTPNYQFPYLTLASPREIRLITISAGRFNDPLVCTLSHKDLDSHQIPEYETISYCWGNAAQRNIIVLNNLPISVPSSSAAALRHVRLCQSDRTVWLDAICINQNDIEERSRQVAIMGAIYRNGTRNLIYLGDEDVGEARDSIAAILKDASETEGSFSRLRNELGAWQYSSTGMKAKYSTQSLLRFFGLPWFRRVWVLQEAALARTNQCFCGSSHFDLLDATRAAAWLVYNYYFVDPDLRLQCSYTADMNDVVDSTHGYHCSGAGKAPRALYLLDLGQQRLATNPVDKVYGILDMTDDLRLVPDYRKPLAETYRDAAWCLAQEGDLSFLDYVRHRTSNRDIRQDGFPSWVPKWHIGKDLAEDPNFMSLHFDVCPGKKSSVTSLNPHGIEASIVMDGFKLGGITKITDRMRTLDLEDANSLKNIISQIDNILVELGHSDGALDVGTSLATTVVAGVDLHYRPATAATKHGYDCLLEMVNKGSLPPAISDLPENSNTSVTLASQYREAMANACKNRAFFVTESGYFGLGPHFAAQNDVVSVLYGSQFPVVLRPIVLKLLRAKVKVWRHVSLFSGDEMNPGTLSTVTINKVHAAHSFFSEFNMEGHLRYHFLTELDIAQN